MILGTALLSMIMSGVDATPALLLRTSSGDAYAAELSQLSEVTFRDGKVCVNVTEGSDFTTVDSKFVSIRFDQNYTGEFGQLGNQEQNAVTEITADTDAPVSLYDMGGRYVGSSVESLGSGVYLIVKPGQKASKFVVK